MIWFIYLVIAFSTFILLSEESLIENDFGALIFCLFISLIWPLFYTFYVLIIIWIIFRDILK